MHVDYVFLTVRFFLWFDAITVFAAGKSLTDKIYWGKECLHGIYILWRLTAVGKYESNSILSGSHTGESMLALQVKMWKRERVLEDEVFIENTCLGVGSKNAGRNSNEDVVLNTDHVVLLTSGFPRLNICIRYLCSGNKWHTAHFKL